jgi:hypothetical protein
MAIYDWKSELLDLNLSSLKLGLLQLTTQTDVIC